MCQNIDPKYEIFHFTRKKLFEIKSSNFKLVLHLEIYYVLAYNENSENFFRMKQLNYS